MEEIWKDVEGFNGIYQVSNFGKVKRTYANKERILKQSIVNGYAKVNMYQNQKTKTAYVHRMVAQAFIPNPYNLPQVNHKDEDKTNNCVDNLEWCSAKYNCNYGTRNNRMGSAFKKKIFSVDIKGNIEHFNSGVEASKITGISRGTISQVLTDKYDSCKTAGGRLWFYDKDGAEQHVIESGIRPVLHKTRVYSVDKNGNVEYFDSVLDGKRKTGANNIHKSLKNGTKSGGRNWFYND